MRIVCPLCKKQLADVPADFPARPFCSMRCKLADLGNWMDERYCISRPLSEEELAKELGEGYS